MYNDTISHFLTRIRNGHLYKKQKVSFLKVKQCIPLLDIFYNLGYISGYSIIGNQIIINLKYSFKDGSPVLKHISQISKPSRPVYLNVHSLKNIEHQTVILSTTKGMLTHMDAIKENVGGKAICKIY